MAKAIPNVIAPTIIIEDAESSVKFVYKTAETVAAADTTAAETETVKEGNIFTHLWQRIVNLFKF